MKPKRPKKSAAQLRSEQEMLKQQHRDEARMRHDEEARKRKQIGQVSLLGSGGELGLAEAPQPAAKSKLGVY